VNSAKSKSYFSKSLQSVICDVNEILRLKICSKATAKLCDYDYEHNSLTLSV